MINYIIRLIVCGVVVYILPQYLSGVHVDQISTAFIVAFVMSILNTFVKPILQIISIPITLLTLGIFSLVISAAMVFLCSYLVPGFQVTGFWHALILSFALSITNSIVSSFQD